MMSDVAELNQIISEIEDVAESLFYSVERREDETTVTVYCEFAPLSPMSLRFTLVKQDKQIFVNGTVRAVGLAGDKTDVHDVLSTLWAVYLRMHFGISVVLQSVVMEDILPDEIYSRRIFFVQPFLHTSPFDVKQGKHILETTRLVSMDIQNFMMQVVNDPDYWGEHQEPVSNSEQQRILEALKSCGVTDSLLSAYRRTNPDWDYYIVVERGISILNISTNIEYSRERSEANLESLIGVNDVIVFPEGGTTRNSVQKKRLSFAKKLARAITGYNDNKCLIVPIDSDLIVIWHKYLIRIPASTGYPFFLKERERIIQRRNREAFIINDDLRFEWATKIDDEEFELFIAELLSKEPGVARVRKVSAGREQDRGRDLMVDWYLPSSNPNGAYQRYRFVVQCKAYSKSVNKSNVQDIRDTVDRHKADGYLLVVSSSLTTSLFDYLDDLRSRRELLVEWWTRTEIEDRIRRNPDLLKRFATIVTRHTI